MALKTEGIWPCTVLSGRFGVDSKDSPTVIINVEITDGPDKGKRCTYEDQVNAKSALYVGRSCKAVGWKGVDLSTLEADIAAHVAATGGATTVEIRHLEIKTGKRAGSTWDKVNSIGRQEKSVKAASGERLTDANEAMRQAMADDSGNDEPTDLPF